MSRVAGRITLSIRLNHFPPLTPFPSADTMRSVQIVASAHHKSRGCPPVASLPCLAVTALPGLSCSIPNLSHPASCLPSLETSFPAPSTARSGLGSTKALTPDDLTQTARSLRLRRLAVPTFRPQPRDPPNCRFEYQPPSAPEVVPGFAIHEQARHKTPPKQVRHPTDCRFTSGCSPPRLAATQLPSISGLRPTQARTCTVQTKRPHGRTHGRAWPGHPRLCHARIENRVITGPILTRVLARPVMTQ